MDIVIPLQIRDKNPDLKYTLRTFDKNLKNFDGKIFFSGSYRPSWVTDEIEVIENKQNRGKWLNSLYNIVAACHDKRVSEEFLLANDDFFLLKKADMENRKEFNYCRGKIQDKIDEYQEEEANTKSMWKKSFKRIKELLESLGSQHYMDFTLHRPMIFHKEKFLEIFNKPQVQEYLKTSYILSYRSLYGNIYFEYPELAEDKKLLKGQDYSKEFMGKEKWLSVNDDMVDNPGYPNLNKLLKKYGKCHYEK